MFALMYDFPCFRQRPSTGYTGSVFANGLATRTIQRRHEEMEQEKQALVATYAAGQIKNAEGQIKNAEGQIKNAEQMREQMREAAEKRLALAQFELQRTVEMAEQ
eukprot:2559286-Pyramimonas_sp.AAC.1